MGILAIGEYIKHWKRNVFVVIQISVLLLVLCVSVTMLATSGELPSIITGNGEKKSMLCNFSLQLKKTLIAATYGDMRYYINTTGLKNIEGTGILQRIDPVRKEVFQRGIGLKEKLKNEKGRDGKIKMYYEWLDSYLKRELQGIKELYVR